MYQQHSIESLPHKGRVLCFLYDTTKNEFWSHKPYLSVGAAKNAYSHNIARRYADPASRKMHFDDQDRYKIVIANFTIDRAYSV